MESDAPPADEDAVRAGADVKSRTRHTGAFAHDTGERLGEEPSGNRVAPVGVQEVRAELRTRELRVILGAELSRPGSGLSCAVAAPPPAAASGASLCC